MTDGDEVVGQAAIDALPPAGDARRGELRRRSDRLAERAEAAAIDGGPIDPKALRVENELAQHFNMLDVTNPEPSYVYAWVNFMSQHGLFVRMKLAQRWEVVQGDMPEAVELKGIGADTTRRLGDVLLMRCRRDLDLLNRRREQAARTAQQQGVTGTLREMAEKYSRRGVIVTTTEDGTLDGDTLKRMQNNAAGRQQATRFVDQHVRQGTMPGVPAPGREGG